jgi:2-dehydropantoate 2-reductase
LPALSDPHWHVLGAGAIGSLFAAALGRRGYATTLILRNAQPLESTPVIVQDDDQRKEMRLPVFSPGDSKPITHLLITTKAYDARSALVPALGRCHRQLRLGWQYRSGAVVQTGD